MRRLVQLQCVLLVVALSVPAVAQNLSSPADEIAAINRAIAEKGAKWTAGENWVTKLPPEERKRLCGTILEPADPSVAPLLTIPMIDSLPPTFDWRDNNGNWVTPPKDQGLCGSCWAFSEVGQVEAWWKIHNDNLDSMIDLSEQFLLSCSDGSCDGWYPGLALEFIRLTGVPTESCFPYRAYDNILCSLACADWEDEAIKIPGWSFVTWDEPIVDIIKNAVYRHPVSAKFTVYSDFMAYSSGVYEHVSGEEQGGHGIVIVGWNDDEQSWICKNSWGTEWGETANFTPHTPGAGDGGYFRIKWGNCGIGSYIPFIWDEMTGGPALRVEPDRFDLTLRVGDSPIQMLMVTNTGPAVLEYSSWDYGGRKEPKFHPDGFNAWDGLSWWCSDPTIGGYTNHWLQYLDTPMLDLSNTAEPLLLSMAFWSIEDPAGVDPPYDGWDGCNVWVSADGGETFEVMSPTSPPYTCQSLWSFGHPEQGWNMGVGIAGWAGNSGGWIPITFDLANFKSDSVIIRYAFASDGGGCTLDDPLLYGLFLDDITVSDGPQMIFEDHGDDINTMERSGAPSLVVADWIDISNGAGVLAPSDFANVELEFDTKYLTPGGYGGLIYFSSNDSTRPLITIPFDLEIIAPDHDVAIQDVWLPGEGFPVMFPVSPGAIIENRGLNDETNINVACTVAQDGQVVFGDTSYVSSLEAGASTIVRFDPFMVLETANLSFSIELFGIPNDYNDYNNIVSSSTDAINLVDGFETETGFWSFQGGWGITNKFGGHTGDLCVHVNGGESYVNDMDAKMTFTPGFDITSVDKATLKYWTKHSTEKDKDICYVEASGDSTTWVKLDSVSGINFTAWTQREVALTDFITAGYSKVWVRFRFISDGATALLGALIDDVEIFPTGPTSVPTMASGLVPTTWGLSQNYPNPFNMTTKIEYSMPQAGDVQITIYNVGGQVVRGLLKKSQTPGYHSVDWNGCDDYGSQVGTGVYLYRLDVEGLYTETRKLVLMK